jgi:Protein of unknown function (DUF2846)
MKTTLIFLLLASPAFAQNAPASTLALSACGPANVNFDVKPGQSQPSSAPESGKALVYVIGDAGGGRSGWAITVKVGLDGSWMGATHGNSYFSFSTPPGEHHLCSNWQSKLQEYSSLYSVASFTAEAGKTYYFRARATTLGGLRLDLKSVNDDEGRYQTETFPSVVSHPKK